MQISVGLMEGRSAVEVKLKGHFSDSTGRTLNTGKYRLTSPQTLRPVDAHASFDLSDVTIGLGFHWERREQQAFRGGLRIIRRSGEREGLTVINDVELED